MIDALVGGKLYKQAEARRSQNGNTYVLAKVRAADGDGESMFISVIAFDQQAQDALLALADGDSVSLAGPLKIGTYTGRDGTKASVSMTAQRVLTAYHVSRKRRALEAAGGAAEAFSEGFDDPI
ncbi:single-stranded DNA-binding protein [Caballeronia sp. GAFFF2]|uniref:single-stranded DNA-binding protein n=1 Tax=Caballeronia sp. GAFFF2 TaxID=2921741 RepID=UPI00202872DA